MKKITFGSIVMLLTVSLFAQPEQKLEGPPKPPPIAERWKRDSIKLQLYVNINSKQLASVKNAFVSFYNDLDAIFPKAQNDPPQKEDINKIIRTRNEALKSILNNDQLDRFQTFEKEFLPPPPHPSMNRDNTQPR